MASRIAIDPNKIAKFCSANHIRQLSLFGSILRTDFGPESDVDMLVEFEPEHIPGLLDMSRMQRELSEMVGRNVDFRTPATLHPSFRREVMDSSECLYVRQ